LTNITQHTHSLKMENLTLRVFKLFGSSKAL
jgi:hypothetical protein